MKNFSIKLQYFEKVVIMSILDQFRFFNPENFTTFNILCYDLYNQNANCLAIQNESSFKVIGQLQTVCFQDFLMKVECDDNSISTIRKIINELNKYLLSVKTQIHSQYSINQQLKNGKLSKLNS